MQLPMACNFHSCGFRLLGTAAAVAAGSCSTGDLGYCKGSLICFSCLLLPCSIISCAGDRSGAQIVDDTLRSAAARGINTVRMWAHTTTALYPFQVRLAGKAAAAQQRTCCHTSKVWSAVFQPVNAYVCKHTASAEVAEPAAATLAQRNISNSSNCNVRDSFILVHY